MVATAETALGSSAFDEPAAVRAFGRTRADLNLDFSNADRLALATALVANCAASADEPANLIEQAWALPVSARIALLLRIVRFTIESDALPVTFRCPVAACGQTLEVSLPFEHLLEVSTTETVLEASLPHGHAVQLRRPTGLDQRAWRTQEFTTQCDALSRVVQSLTLAAPEDACFDEDAISALAAAMEEFDPLTAFRVITSCPHCGAESVFAVDLEAEALRLLAAHARALLSEVHTLATHYGWSEAEVIALPPHRRAQYLRMITEADRAPMP